MTESNSRAVQDAAARRGVRIASRKWKKGGSGKSYSQLTHSIFQSPQYAKLSPRAVKLLIDLLAQYRGTNNGDLTTAWSLMERVAGWKSKDLLAQATRELEQRGWILRTRQGSRNAATLWALTFHGIDDCRDKNGARKFDAGIRPDSMPLHLWRDVEHDLPADAPKRSFKTRSDSRLPGKAAPATGKPQDEKDPKVTDLTPYLSRLSG